MKRLTVVAFALGFAALAQGQSPPSIPHSIDGYLVTRQENSCLECHDRPRDIGKPREKGLSPPAPKSHYAKLEGKGEIGGKYYTCTSCHSRK